MTEAPVSNTRDVAPVRKGRGAATTGPKVLDDATTGLATTVLEETTTEPEFLDEAKTGEHPQDYSDVFVCPRDDDADIDEAATSVTLFVYGWDNVEPGPLSWAFPSLRAALDAVRTMRNAIAWSIAAGRDHLTVEEARANGAVLIEQG